MLGPGAGVNLSGQHPCSVDTQPHPSKAEPRAVVVSSGQQPNSVNSQPQPLLSGPSAAADERVASTVLT